MPWGAVPVRGRGPSGMVQSGVERCDGLAAYSFHILLLCGTNAVAVLATVAHLLCSLPPSDCTAQHSTVCVLRVLDGGLCYTCSRDASVSALPVTNGRWCCGQRIPNACSWPKPCLPLAAPACLHALLLVCCAWWCLYHRCRGSVASFRLWGPLLDLTTAYCLARALAPWCFCSEPSHCCSRCCATAAQH
jgi:hypothetical protein